MLTDHSMASGAGKARSLLTRSSARSATSDSLQYTNSVMLVVNGSAVSSKQPNSTTDGLAASSFQEAIGASDLATRSIATCLLVTTRSRPTRQAVPNGRTPPAVVNPTRPTDAERLLMSARDLPSIVSQRSFAVASPIGCCT